MAEPRSSIRNQTFMELRRADGNVLLSVARFQGDQPRDQEQKTISAPVLAIACGRFVHDGRKRFSRRRAKRQHIFFARQSGSEPERLRQQS